MLRIDSESKTNTHTDTHKYYILYTRISCLLNDILNGIINRSHCAIVLCKIAWPGHLYNVYVANKKNMYAIVFAMQCNARFSDTTSTQGSPLIHVVRRH